MLPGNPMLPRMPSQGSVMPPAMHAGPRPLATLAPMTPSVPSAPSAPLAKPGLPASNAPRTHQTVYVRTLVPERVEVPADGAITEPPMPLDWAQVRRRLEKVGAVWFELERRETGYRFAIELPQRSAPIECIAANEADAVHLALRRAEAVSAGP